MTTFYNFIPPRVAAFEFQPVLDGAVYTGIVKWNLFGQRNYMDLFGQDGGRIFTLPLIASRSGIALKSLAWSNGRVLAQVAAPHGYKVTDTIQLAVKECLPAAYNGTVEALITGADIFQWPLASNPGTATGLGHVDYNINLVGGYFSQSSMVFNEDSQRIEVTP